MRIFNVVAFAVMAAYNVYSWIRDGFSWLSCIVSVLTVVAFVGNLFVLLKGDKD